MDMDRQKVLEKMRKTAVALFGMDPASIGDETEIESLGIDSLDRTEWCMAVEEELDVEIPTDDVHGARTVGDIADAVLRAWHEEGCVE